MSRRWSVPACLLSVCFSLNAGMLGGCASVVGSGLPAPLFEDPGRQEWLKQVEAHTRSEELITQLDTRLILKATLVSPALLDAEALEQARVYRLPVEQVRMRTEQARAQAASTQQVLIWVAAREPKLAELETGLWRVVLLDSTGTQVEPTRIERIRKPDTAMISFYPHLDSLGLTYRLSFPPLAPSGKAWSAEPTVMLQLAGTQGAVRVAWGH